MPLPAALRPSCVASLLAFAACHTTPATPAPDSSELACRMQMLELGLRSQADWLAQVTASSGPREFESAALAELNGRLEALAAKLDALVPGGPVDAVAGRTEPIAAADAVAIQTLQHALEVELERRNTIVANLANVHTCGFKKLTLVTATRCDAATGAEFPVVERRLPIFTSGALEITERSLDVALDGEGFLVVRHPDGTTGYTRNGNLHVDAQGRLVTGDGGVLQPETTFPNDVLEIAIDPRGKVRGRTASAPDQPTHFGQLQLARFASPATLVPDHHGTWTAEAGASPAQIDTPGSPGLANVQQGFLERSNVQVVNELVNLQLVDRQIAILRRTLASHGIWLR
ncbi:MAG: flagellar hook basal-body protein [Planctomycetes bacterium]|nr:flagellar hook basal-body protein [Planctomycetota bacterium]